MAASLAGSSHCVMSGSWARSKDSLRAPGERMPGGLVGCGRGCQPLATSRSLVSPLPGDTALEPGRQWPSGGSAGAQLPLSSPRSHEPGARQHGGEVRHHLQGLRRLPHQPGGQHGPERPAAAGGRRRRGAGAGHRLQVLGRLPRLRQRGAVELPRGSSRHLGIPAPGVPQDPVPGEPAGAVQRPEPPGQCPRLAGCRNQPGHAAGLGHLPAAPSPGPAGPAAAGGPALALQVPG